MIDFSKVMRSLNEASAPIRRGQGNANNLKGEMFENALANNILPAINPKGDFRRVPTANYKGKGDLAVKTDVYNANSQSGEPNEDIKDNINYSAKVSSPTSNDIGIHDGSHHGGTLSKLMADRNIPDSIRNAIKMKFGSVGRMGNSLHDVFGGSSKFGKDEFMLSNDRFKADFPKEHAELIEHLENNKYEIINGLLRQKKRNGAARDEDAYSGPNAFDPSPVRRLAHLRLNDNKGSLDGNLEFHNLDDDLVKEFMENFEWSFPDGYNNLALVAKEEHRSGKPAGRDFNLLNINPKHSSKSEQIRNSPGMITAKLGVTDLVKEIMGKPLKSGEIKDQGRQGLSFEER